MASACETIFIEESKKWKKCLNLPDQNVPVIICTRDGTKAIAQLEKTDIKILWCNDYNSWELYEVTHWIELPKWIY
jgi:predicted Fe-Mo cluster-binding NifX family protein